MMRVAEDLGYKPIFFGAFRERGLPNEDEWDGWEVQRIGAYFPLVNGKRPLLYVLSVLGYALALIARLIRLRPGVVHVSDFEVFWPARLYTLVARIPLIYNIHDNLAQRYRCPSAAAKALNLLEGMAARLATVTVVPEGFRRDALPTWCRANVEVVKNAPVDPGFRAPADGDPGTVNILSAGWIDSGRGIRKLTELVAGCEDCRLVLAGEGDPELVEEAAGAERIDYRGYLKNERVIEETAKCDFVAALYDPIRPINRFAASNKIAEALAVGRPLIINEEQEIVALLREYDCAVIATYADAGRLGPVLRELRRDSRRYEAMCKRARDAYESHYSWEIVHRASVDLYAAVGVHALDRAGARGPNLLPEVANKQDMAREWWSP